MASSRQSRLGKSPEEGIKAPVVTTTDAAITLSGLQTVGGVAVTAGNRVLVKDQVDPIENGIYVASEAAWSRATDFNKGNDVTNGVLVLDADDGNLYQAVIVGDWSPGTTAVTFRLVVQLGQGGGSFLPLAGGTMTGDIVMSGTGRMITFNSTGKIDFSNVAASTGEYRYRLATSGGATVKGFFGTDAGYNNARVFLERDEINTTPFFEGGTRIGSYVPQVRLNGDGGAMFSDEIAIWDYENNLAFGYGIFSTTAGSSANADGALIIAPAVTNPLTGLPQFSRSEIIIETYEAVSPITSHRIHFKANGQFTLARDPIDDLDAVTKQWAVANLGGGSGALPPGAEGQMIAHNGTAWIVLPTTGVNWNHTLGLPVFGYDQPSNTGARFQTQFSLIDRDSTIWDLMDISLQGAGSHEFVLSHRDDSTPSNISLVTNNGTPTETNTWRFLNDGQFTAPGDIIIDSAGQNAGAFELRNYEATGGDAWFSSYVSNNVAEDGIYILTPARTAAGTPTFYSGAIRLITNPTAGTGDNLKEWNFESTGYMTAPGDIQANSRFNAVMEEVPDTIWLNGWAFGSTGINEFINEGFLRPSSHDVLLSDKEAIFKINTREWDTINLVPIEHYFTFNKLGGFEVPGDLIIDSDAVTGQPNANKGSLEIRNYQPKSVDPDDDAWFGMFATTNIAPGAWNDGDDGTFYISPARDNASGTPVWYKGSFALYTYGVSAGGAFDSDQLHEWRFKTNGDFIAPGDIRIDSMNTNEGALEIRNIEEKGVADNWWNLYVGNATNAGGIFGALNLQPAVEDTPGVPTLYRGEFNLYTNPTAGTTNDLRRFHFDMEGNLHVPRSLRLGQSAGLDGSLEIKNWEGAGDQWWSLYVGSGGQAQLVPALDGTFNDGEMTIFAKDGSSDLRGYKFSDNGKFAFLQDSVERGYLWLEDFGDAGVFFNMEMYAASDARVKAGGTVRLQLNGGEYLNLGTTEVVSNKNIRSIFNLIAGTQITIGSAAPTNVDHATRKDYVDAGDASDMRLKENVRDLRYGLAEVTQLDTILFDYIESAKSVRRAGEKDRPGLSAQQVMEIMPELVHLMPDGEHLGIDYAEFVPVLINAITQLSARVEELETVH